MMATSLYLSEDINALIRSASKSNLPPGGLPNIIDKKQAKWSYRLERVPTRNTKLFLDSPRTNDVPSRSQPMRAVHPQQIASNYLMSTRTYPSMTSTPRDESSSYDDRQTAQQGVRYRLDPDGLLLFDNSYTRSDSDFQYSTYQFDQPVCHPSPRDQVVDPLPPLQTHGRDPFLKSISCASIYDKRSRDVLDWDRTQTRHIEFHRNPMDTPAPSPRARQNADSIDAYNFQSANHSYISPRAEQPKSNISSPKGKAYWSKKGPLPYEDLADDAYVTTTADVHRALPIDYSSPRYTNLHGMFSKSISNIMPYNPYHPVHESSETVNGSLDSRPHLVLQQLPRIKLPPRVRVPPKPEPTAEEEKTT